MKPSFVTFFVTLKPKFMWISHNAKTDNGKRIGFFFISAYT